MKKFKKLKNFERLIQSFQSFMERIFVIDITTCFISEETEAQKGCH